MHPPTTSAAQPRSGTTPSTGSDGQLAAACTSTPADPTWSRARPENEAQASRHDEWKYPGSTDTYCERTSVRAGYFHNRVAGTEVVDEAVVFVRGRIVG